MPPLTPTAQALLLVNVVMFCLQYFLGPQIVQWLALWPIGEGFLPWQIVTYAFLHGSFSHLFFNMFGLWMFGSEVESMWGPKRFLQFYMASVLTAAAAQLIVTYGSPGYPTVGASGGLFGVLLAFAMLFPNRTVLLFFVVPVKAAVLVTLYGLLELYQGVTGTAEGVAHFAHLGGMLGGFLMIRYWRGQAPFGRRRR